MKKSSPAPKELLKRRIAKNLLMKIPQQEFDMFNKENKNPGLVQNIENKMYKPHDRQLKDEDPHNPFDLPNHFRLFSRSHGPRAIRSEPNIMSEPYTICDIDETFFKVIEGRPLRQFTDVKVYMRNIRDITLFRANSAYLKDQIIQINTAIADEAAEYRQIATLFDKTKINFVQFAKDSFQKAKTFQMIAEEKSLELSKMTEQLESYSFQYVKLRNEMSALAATFETLSRYHKFLNLISPNTWQEKQNKGCLKRIVQCTQTQGVASSSAALIDTYKNNLENLLEMPLYFKKPRELMHVYDNLGRQCLNYMEIGDFSNKILTSVLKRRDYLKETVTTEIDEMKGFVDVYESHVAWVEEKAFEYKSVFDHLLTNSFYTLYASYDTTKLFTCVQYVNTQIFRGPEDPKDKVSTLMLHLESLYIDLTSGLDNLDQEVVKAATNQLFSEDIKMMKRAHMAQRTIRECDILKNALYTSFEPPKVIKKNNLI